MNTRLAIHIFRRHYRGARKYQGMFRSIRNGLFHVRHHGGIWK